jgi:hypothetical protein
MPQRTAFPESTGINRRKQTMTKTKLSMMAAALVGAAVFATLSPALAKGGIVQHPGNVVHQQLYDSAGKPVNRLPARALGGTPHKVTCRNFNNTNWCTSAI